MRIKKISPTTPANGNIENQYGTSQTNAYSEKYINDRFDGTKTTGDMVVNSIKTKNLFNKSAGIDGYLTSSGNVVSNSDHRVSDYIDIDGISNITISGSQGSGLENCFYNSSKAVIGHFSFSSASTTQEVPSGTKYIRLTVKKTALDTYQLEDGTTATSYTGYFDSNSAVSDSILWDGTTYDISTENNVDTWIPVVNKSKLQHTTISSIVDRGSAISTTGQLTLLSNYFSTIDINKVYKSGHVVEVSFRGLVANAIPNNASYLVLPYATANNLTLTIGVGGRYDYDATNGQRWAYIGGDNNNEFRGGVIEAGKWIHINWMYLTNS